MNSLDIAENPEIPQANSPGRFKAKIRATSIHFSLSVCVFAVLLYFLIFQWYPGILFATDGGWQGLQILGAVDLILGPLLTFIVFNPRKPRREIITDLSLIGLVQICALAWGTHIVYDQRPVALAFWKGAIYSAKTERFDKQHITPEQLANFGTTPVLVYAKEPADAKNQVQSVTLAMTDGISEFEQFILYQPFQANMAEIVTQLPSEEHLNTKYPHIQQALKQTLQSLPPEVSAGRILIPFQGRHHDAVMIFDQSGKLITGIVVD